MTASDQLPSSTDEQTLNVVFATQVGVSAATFTVAATSTVALLSSCLLLSHFAVTYIAARFSQRQLWLRPFVSVHYPPQFWDSTLSFNFEIGLCIVTAWAIPCALIWNLGTPKFIYEFMNSWNICIHILKKSYEFIVYMNSYMNSLNIIIIWIHIWNDYINSWVYEFMYEMIIWEFINMNSNL